MQTKQKRLNKGEDQDIYNILYVSILIISNLNLVSRTSQTFDSQ